MTTRRRSLIRRLIRIQVLAMIATWAVLLCWTGYQMAGVGNGDLDRRMLSFAATLAETAAGARSTPNELPARLQAVEKIFVSGVIETIDNLQPYAATYQVVDAGVVVYSTGTTPARPWVAAVGFSDASFQGHHVRLVRTESYDGGVAVIVAESDAMRRASLLPLFTLLGGSELTILLVSVLALWWAAHRGFEPVRRLALDVARRQSGDRTLIANKGGYAELAPLIHAFNGLLEREALQLDSERGFLADAAHELRTPLAAVSAQAHRLTAATDDTTRAQAADALQRGIQRVSHLLTQLLTTARIDATTNFTQRDPVDLAELLRLKIAALVPIARRKSIDMSLDSPESVVIAANLSGLTSIVENLVDNAIRYTPEGGSVVVELKQGSAEVELVVKDTGPGISPELRERVFERFFRVPGVQAEGTGLGLAIVKKLSEAYGAPIQLGTGLNGQGLSVAMTFAVQPIA